MGRNKVKKEDCSDATVAVLVIVFVFAFGFVIHKAYKELQAPDYLECYSGINGDVQYKIDSIYNENYLDLVATNGVGKREIIKNWPTELFLEVATKQSNCALFNAFIILERKADKEK